jgi:N-acetyltransferase
MEFTVAGLCRRWVRLEPLSERHREGLRTAAADPRIWELQLVNGGDAFDAVFDQALVAPTRLSFAVRLLRTGELVGATAFIDPVAAHKRVEVGWTWFHPAHWGTAVNPECKLLLLTHAFEVWGLNRVQFSVDARNLRSQAAVSKLGAAREGVLRAHAITYTGYVRDTVVFSIIAADWPVVKARLQARLAGFAGAPDGPGA